MAEAAHPDHFFDVAIIGGGPAGLTAGIDAARANLRTILVQPGTDAHGVLAAALSERPAAIHVLAHGEPGRIRLGSVAIDADSLLDRHWPAAPGCEILIHACRVGAGAAGRRFLDRLSAATGAAVAASSRPVGDAARGGSWLLDRTTAPVAALAPFVGHEGWPHLLAVTSTPIGYGIRHTSDDADDTIASGDGNDELFGNGGNDWLDGGLGADTLDGGAGADTLDGGIDLTAFDRVTYASAGTAGIVLDLENPANSQGYAAGDTILRIELIEGSAGDDRFVDKTTLADGATGNTFFWGHDGHDTLSGAAGDDTLEGGYGNDWLDGGIGNDQLFGHWQDDTVLGGAGDDFVNGGAGNDLVIGDSGRDLMVGGYGLDTLFAGTEDDALYGNQGSDALYGNQGNDTLFGGQDADALFGGQDSDLLYGQLASDAVYGQLGMDTLFGGQGDDTLFGGQGDDLLFGNIGDDTLIGNLGNDTLEGNEGADTFVMTPGEGAATITDFDAAAGDRMMVEGGMTWTIADGDAGAVVLFSTGDQVTLTGIRAADVLDTWFTTG